ncbi:MAG: nitrilase-related carbon-nitrogen hydrolase [Alphaproteobacteria bacterium]
MTEIFTAVGVQTNAYDCKYKIGDKPNYVRNLKHIAQMIDVAVLHSMEHPVRLIALAEGAIQGFPDEYHDWDPVEYARNGAIDVPGPETDILAEKAMKWKSYLIAQAKTRMPEFPDRFFNTAFVIDPAGKIIHQHRKNVVFTLEHTTTPHDVYDQWVQMFGTGLDAFFPVARTPIGNIGANICMEGNFPEMARGIALNGGEILYRPSSAENKVSLGIWEVQNRARAIDNNCYVVAPNTGHIYIDDDKTEGFMTGGRSMIVDYRGQVLHINHQVGDAFVGAPIHIDALRQHRAKATHMNWLPHLKSEVYRLIYQKTVWPKNMAMKDPPKRRDAMNEVFYQTVNKLKEEGVIEAAPKG